MGDLGHCGCGGTSRDNGGCNSIIWIIILLFLCGGCSGSSDCGSQSGFGLSSFGGDGCGCIIIILLLLCSCGGGTSLCG